MGLFDWLKRSPAPPRDDKAQYLWRNIDGAVAERKLDMIANACAALSGRSAMAFGMVVGDFPGREEVRAHAFDALRSLASDLSEAETDQLVTLVDHHQLDLDISEQRARRDAARATYLAAASEELRRAIPTLAPIALVHAAAALRSQGLQIAGVALPRDAPARPEVLEQCYARLRTLIQELPDEECAGVIGAIRRAHLPLEVADRSAQLAQRRRADRPPPAGEPTNPELERAIVENPDDAAAYSVLADWLQDRHPRGELIALQLRAETEPALRRTVEHYLETHSEVLLGSLATYRLTRDGRMRHAFVWRRGFIDRLVLSHDAEMFEVDDPTSCAEILELAMHHPSARLVRAIDVGINRSAAEGSLEDVVEALAHAPPALLREVLLGDFNRDQCEISWFHIGNIAPIWTIPTLRRLVVHGAEFELGTVAHAQLEHLEIQTGNLDVANATSLANAKLPAVRHLDIWYGDPNYGGDATLAEVMPLLARDDLPALTHLGLMNAMFSDDICERLANAKLSGQLRSLDLSLGTLSDDGIAALVAAASALPLLERLNISETYVTREGVAEVERGFPNVEIIAKDLRRGGEDDRYVAVGE